MTELLETARGAVFLGEAGSGKTELAVNWAMAAAGRGERVALFDMDQTKGLFRARDLSAELSAAGVRLIDGASFQDAPVIPPGVLARLEEGSERLVFDVGGSPTGARMIGQFARELAESGSAYYYVINPMRPFSAALRDIEEGLGNILRAAGADPGRVSFVSNPCMGDATEPEEVLACHRLLCEELARGGLRASFLAASERWASALTGRAGCPVFPIRLYVRKLYRF